MFIKYHKVSSLRYFWSLTVCFLTLPLPNATNFATWLGLGENLANPIAILIQHFFAASAPKMAFAGINSATHKLDQGSPHVRCTCTHRDITLPSVVALEEVTYLLVTFQRIGETEMIFPFLAPGGRIYSICNCTVMRGEVISKFYHDFKCSMNERENSKVNFYFIRL